MAFALFELLLTWWPVSAALMVVLSWWLARRRRSWHRHAAMLLLVLLGPLLLLAEGLATGCALQPARERCYWFGFGLTLATLMIVPANTLLIAFGVLGARWFRQR